LEKFDFGNLPSVLAPHRENRQALLPRKERNWKYIDKNLNFHSKLEFKVFLRYS